MSGSSLAGWVMAASLVASCGVGSPSTGEPSTGGLPTHKDLNGYPAALLEATLVRDGQCLYAEGLEANGRWLPIWPSGFGLSGDAVMNGSAQIATVGDHVRLGGGEYHESQYDFLRTLMPADVPAACRGGEYWLVGEVVP